MDKEKIILALDIASETGWCIDTSTYGTWDFKTKKDESMGMKLIKFEAKLKEFYLLFPFDIVIYERPAGRHAYSIIHQSKLIAILESFCEKNSIEYRAYSAKQIKLFATGKGNSSKQEMIKAASISYNYIGNNDNEADAIHLRELFRKEYNL